MNKIDKIFKDIAKDDGKESEVIKKIDEAGDQNDLGILLNKCIDERNSDKTVDELKKFLKAHPELTYKAQETLERSVVGAKDVGLLFYVSKVLAKLNKPVTPEQLANNEIVDSMEKSKIMREPIKLLEKVEDEESLEDAKNALGIALEKRHDLRDEFVRTLLDLLIKSVDKDGNYTPKSNLLENAYQFLINEDY